MLRGDTIRRCSCQGLKHGIIMTNLHIWGGSGCLSPRCFLPLTPVRPYCEQKYHYALTSRRSPSPSSVFVLIWVMHWLDYKPNFWFFRWQSLQRFRLGSVLWLMSLVQKNFQAFTKNIIWNCFWKRCPVRTCELKSVRYMTHEVLVLDVIICRVLSVSLSVISQARIYKAPLIRCPPHTCVVGILKRGAEARLR